MIGTVINFDKKKGFGFVRSTEGKSVFLHAREWKACGMEGWPQVDQSLNFEIGESDRGLRAVDITKVTPSCP